MTAEEESPPVSKNAYDRLCPAECTEAALDYWHRHVQNYELWAVADLIADDLKRLVVERGLLPVSLRIRANTILQEGGHDYDEEELAELLAKQERRDPDELALEPDRKTLEIGKWIGSEFAPLMNEVFIVRTVDNMLTYLADALIAIHRERPETLRSSAPVSYEDVLSHDSLESFVSWAAEDRVERLARRGFGRLAADIRTRLKIDLTRSEKELNLVTLIVAVRNSLVHRRGIVDRQFIEAVRTTSFGEVGDSIDLRKVRDARALPCSIVVVDRFDARIAAKYGLKKVKPTPRPSWADFALAGQKLRPRPTM